MTSPDEGRRRGDPGRVGSAPDPGRISSAGLTFPDAPRLELESMLVALTDQAQSVLSTQGRLRALLRATATVTGDLDLRVVLHRIVEAARELVDAQYAALGVVREGELVEFVHTGMDEATVARIGDLPKGLGLLGHLVDHPEPLRLADLAGHPSAAGFPEHHPPMVSFLGVPIRVGDSVFGHLYLTESARGKFSEDDQQLVTALAHSAAAAIANSRVYAEVKEQRRWMAASTQLTQELLEGSMPGVGQVATHAAIGADADLAVIAVPGEDGTLRIESAAGALADQLGGVVVQDDDDTLSTVFSSGIPRLVEGYQGSFADVDPSTLGPVVVVRLQAREQPLGTLSIARLANRPAFTRADLDHIVLFAAQAGLALELDRGRSERELLTVLLDRQRIADDLHRHVVHELFDVGMRLQSLSARVPESADLRPALLELAEDLDATIRHIRTAVFGPPDDPT